MMQAMLAIPRSSGTWALMRLAAARNQGWTKRCSMYKKSDGCRSGDFRDMSSFAGRSAS